MIFKRGRREESSATLLDQYTKCKDDSLMTEVRLRILRNKFYSHMGCNDVLQLSYVCVYQELLYICLRN